MAKRNKHRSGNRKKPWLVATMAVLFILLVCFLILEVTVRIFFPQNSVQFVADDAVGWLHEPNIRIQAAGPEYRHRFRTNEQGFMDSYDYELTKPADVQTRILWLGDSFLEAQQVAHDKSVAQLTEELLSDATGSKVESLNTGASGYGTDNEYLLLKNYGVQYKPDVVILLFTPGNDVKDNYFEQGRNQIVLNVTQDGEVVELERNVEPYPEWQRFIGKHSQLAYMVNFKIIPALQRSLGDADELNTEYYREFGVFNKNYSPEWQDAWERTEKLILATKEEAEENGAQFVLVIGTNKFQLNDELYNQAKEKYPQFSEEYVDLEKPEKLLADFCVREKINCLDLLPAFSTHVEETAELPHYVIDGHWNELGHELAAESIAKYLVAQSIVKKN